MTIKEVKVKRYRCKCEKCGHIWYSDKKPNACAKCKQIGWNKKERKRG